MKIRQWLAALPYRDDNTGIGYGNVRWSVGCTPPFGCRWCGVDQRSHPFGPTWIRGRGMHVWEQPTQAQIKARMLARRNARKAVCRCLEPWEEHQQFAPWIDPWKCEAADCRMADHLLRWVMAPLSFEQARAVLDGGDA